MSSSIRDLPFLHVLGMEDPAALDAPLLHLPDGEVLEGPAVELDGRDEIDALGAVLLLDEEGVDGRCDGRHPRGRHEARRVRARPVALEKGQHPLQVIGRRVGDARVAPGGHKVAEGGLELVGVAVGLRGGEVERLDDGPLVPGESFLHGVEPVDGEGVELHRLHPGEVGLPFGDELGGLLHVLADSRTVFRIRTHDASRTRL